MSKQFNYAYCIYDSIHSVSLFASDASYFAGAHCFSLLHRLFRLRQIFGCNGTADFAVAELPSGVP